MHGNSVSELFFQGKKKPFGQEEHCNSAFEVVAWNLIPDLDWPAN